MLVYLQEFCFAKVETYQPFTVHRAWGPHISGTLMRASVLYFVSSVSLRNSPAGHSVCFRRRSLTAVSQRPLCLPYLKWQGFSLFGFLSGSNAGILSSCGWFGIFISILFCGFIDRVDCRSCFWAISPLLTYCILLLMERPWCLSLHGHLLSGG